MKTLRLETENLSWRVQTWGEPSRRAVVFLHGFTWQGAAWAPIAQALATKYYCVAPDLPGHGATSWPVPMADWPFVRVVEAIQELIRSLELAEVSLVGYSMGGRLALNAALSPTSKLKSLVLIGASAGLATSEARRLREQADSELAASLLHTGTESFLARWTAMPMFKGMQSLSEESQAAWHAMRRTQDPHGLAAALLTMGTGAQPYLMERLGDCACPTLLVVGEEDAKFRGIAAEMLAHLPEARLEIAAGCGHSVPFERPEHLYFLLDEFLIGAPQATSLR